jgi:hypothetical protein
MNELIEALTILAKYAQPAFPTHCEHDVLFIMVDPAVVSAEDLARLEELRVVPSSEGEAHFESYWFGSA